MLTQDPIGLAGGVNLYAYAGNNPTSFSDPFGLCPKRVGGDGQTSSVDDCSTEVAAAWQKDHIHNTSTNKTDLDGVDPTLMDAVVRTSMQYGVDLGISAGKEGGHSVDGGHADGLAVDINVFGSTHFKDMSRSDARMAGNMIGGSIVNRLGGENIHIAITPGMAFDTMHPMTARQTRNNIGLHFNHVHISIRPIEE